MRRLHLKCGQRVHRTGRPLVSGPLLDGLGIDVRTAERHRARHRMLRARAHDHGGARRIRASGVYIVGAGGCGVAKRRSNASYAPTRAGAQTGRKVNDRIKTSMCLQALAWIAAEEGNPSRAVVLAGAAEKLSRSVGSSTVLVPACSCTRTSANVRLDRR